MCSAFMGHFFVKNHLHLFIFRQSKYIPDLLKSIDGSTLFQNYEVT